MEVVFTKADGPGRPDRTLIVDRHGARRVPVHVVHDLPHLVVESVFGLYDGLWGELARGEHQAAARAAAARDPRRQKLGRIVSGAAAGEPTTVWLSAGHRRAKAVTNAVVNHWKEGPDTPAGVRARLRENSDPVGAEVLSEVDDATIQLAIEGVRRILEQWTRVAPGESLRLAWPWPAADSYGEPVTTLEEAAANWRGWFNHGQFDEGAARVHAALTAPGADAPSVERVRVLYGAHLFAFRRGEPSGAYAQECLDLARQLGDVRGESDGLTGLAREALRAGDYPRSAEFASLGLEKAKASGDRAAEASPLHLCAAATRLSGDYDRARSLYLDSVALADELADEGRKQQEFHNLGWVELHRGDVDAAERMFAERDARAGLDAMGDALTELNHAGIALARGQRDEATRRFEVGKQQIDALGASLDPDDQFEFDWLLAQLAGASPS